MDKNSSKQNISKTVSYWLRHAPWEAGLSPDEPGWVKLNRLMSALDECGINLTIDGLEALNHSPDKVRWEIDRVNDHIRASHGHSFPVIVGEAQQPPDTLYHGTDVKSLPAIRQQGILPMNRQFVHLTRYINIIQGRLRIVIS